MVTTRRPKSCATKLLQNALSHANQQTTTSVRETARARENRSTLPLKDIALTENDDRRISTSLRTNEERSPSEIWTSRTRVPTNCEPRRDNVKCIGLGSPFVGVAPNASILTWHRTADQQ